MNKTEQKRQQSAKRSLEFYAFWLWHYIVASRPSFGTFDQFIINKKSDVLTLCKLRKCRNKKVQCKNCELYVHNRKLDYLHRIFFPWTELLNEVPHFSPAAISLRMNSSEMLKATYENHGEFFNSPIGLCLNFKPTTIKGLNIEKRRGEIGYSHSYSAKPEIDLNAPTVLINSDIRRFKAYIEFLEDSDEKHSMALYVQFMNEEGSRQIDFAGMLSELRKFDNISFKPSAHNVRVLGFWLWEQVDLLQNFKTLSDAIKELKSDKHCPLKLHAKMGIGTRANLQTLYQSTKACIEQSEVLAMN